MAARRLSEVLAFGLVLQGASRCVPSDTRFCLSVDIFGSETGYYNVAGYRGSSPDLTVKIGRTYTFDQTDPTNWYHAIGFAFFPDGAHGLTWGGEEQPEVEDPHLHYKINGVSPTGGCAPLGLDCYEPQFFWPKGEWSANKYTAELTVTHKLAQASRGGEIYYFCHIHSKMSGRIRIVNEDGSPLDLSTLAHPTANALYMPVTPSAFDETCGTFDISGHQTCAYTLVPGALDTDFKRCLAAMNCKMVDEMRVLGYDHHRSPIATFMQQMIPHHVNAVNMAKLLLKHAPSQVASVEGFEDILWDIVNTQSYQIHAFRGWLANHPQYVAATDDKGNRLTAESSGHHCGSALPQGTDLNILAGTSTSGSTAAVDGCIPSATNICVTVNHFAGESGYYEFVGHTGPSPEITARVGDTIVFDQRHHTNWFHPIGFAYEPDGAHGAEWGGEERPEVEGAGELQYKINGAAAACPDAGDTGLDCYEPEFFFPRPEWLEKKYTAELTITQAMVDASHGGVLYYFCHIHSRMSGKIRLLKADGSEIDRSSLRNPSELPLYSPASLSGVDLACGTSDLDAYAGGGSKVCNQRFLCGALDTTFEKCMQAIDCKMNRDMLAMTRPDFSDLVAAFMQQMIPHHLNAVNMAKILLKQVSPPEIQSAMDEGELADILYGIINSQNYQIHQFRNYLGGVGYYRKEASASLTESTHPEADDFV